ncbi:probable cationic amino acid transporter [Anneissia japonica]|uniref:probable cationic amino acid transporter n=1 Tax=Anneissia japonica TaxID=1529436 RepID=UPI001425895A|nr:probable cationic amino acid transporter [Anneissia japonica]XP_033097866.1 probable cationic amino acid transporter [Anneissia japonica]
MGYRSVLQSFIGRLLRVKTVDVSGQNENQDVPGKLSRCLSTLDLVSLGVGSCMGTGMYVVSGLVAREMAGPGVIISFMIAAIASILSGVCYAEFGVRVPKTTGSAYMYSYVTVGEFCAFVIGWNLILEYLIGTAAGASALSSCFDSLFQHTYSNFMMDNVGGFGIHNKTYPDILAMIIAIVMTLIIAAGVQKSILFNNVLNIINVAAWVFFIVAGLFFANGENWRENGFFPYGFSGVLTGAATCFYAFIGFDIIATTGEEAKDPSRSIPIAIIVSLVICLIGYVTVSMVLTLAVPYYRINPESPLMDMFVMNHAVDGKYLVAIGAVAGLTVSLLGSIFPMPRVIYAMSMDGLLFRFLSNINIRTQTPAVATVISGFLAALMALLVNLGDLIEMMSIGTLLAYTLVSMSVLILRYQPYIDIKMSVNTTFEYETFDNDEIEQAKAEVNTGRYHKDTTVNEDGSVSLLSSKDTLATDSSKGKQSYGAVDKEEDQNDDFKSYSNTDLNLSKLRERMYNIYTEIRRILGFSSENKLPTAVSGRTVTYSTLCLFSLIFILCSLAIYGQRDRSRWWVKILIVIFISLISICILNIVRQPQNPDKLKFMAPAVPLLPIAAMFINIYLMLNLSTLTWIRFGIWMAIGLIIYFGYGIRNSNIEPRCVDITTRSKDGKEAIVMGTKTPEVATSASVIPAHARKMADSSYSEPSSMSSDGEP